MANSGVVTKLLSLNKKSSLPNFMSATTDCEKLPSIINSPLKSVELFLKEKLGAKYPFSQLMHGRQSVYSTIKEKLQKIHNRHFSDVPSISKNRIKGNINDVNFINIEFYKKLSQATKSSSHRSKNLSEIKKIPHLHRYGIVLHFPRKPVNSTTKRAITPLSENPDSDIPLHGSIGIQSSDAQNRKIIYLKVK